ncbi:MAG TPA: ATP-grasp domain-containing protein, partial [Pirellulaceae bacterium]|nr:ATP-grasp domain-containing protein [Pirellulaceae bacterium]
MKILLYEHVTGGGGWQDDPFRPPSGPLLTEGRAMVQAIAADLAAIEGVEVCTSRDSRLPELHPAGCSVMALDSDSATREWLQQSCTAADWTLLIAPETGGSLLARCQLVEAAGGRLLSPSSAVVEIAGDKQTTAELLESKGIPVPRGCVINSAEELAAQTARLPAVIKPRVGCGSVGVRVLKSNPDLASLGISKPQRLEEYVPGLAASVSVLAGPKGLVSLPACGQRLSQDGLYTYLGGRLPLSEALSARARRLAEAAVSALPPATGYLGVDVILGAAGNGDRVIEINPRLTTSYVGLRAFAKCNLAAAMLAVAEGREPDL